jgi:uncharacterized membrane protein YphA (DoxX/SURF4 family)
VSNKFVKMKNNNTFVYWFATLFIALIFVASGFMKLKGGPEIDAVAAAFGSAQNIRILGSLELLIAIIWTIKRTGVIGTLLAIAYMGGAMAVHFTKNEPVSTIVIIQILIWLAAAYRFPELSSRLLGK